MRMNKFINCEFATHKTQQYFNGNDIKKTSVIMKLCELELETREFFERLTQLCSFDVLREQNDVELETFNS